MFRKCCLCFVGVFSLIGAAMADPPTHITRPPLDNQGPIFIQIESPGPADGTIIYDSLCITDTAAYDNGFGDTCGGTAIFGQPFDLQVADDFVVREECGLNGVIMDYLTFTGACPPLVCISLFKDNGNCGAPETPVCYVEIAPSCVPFTDPIFGLAGVRMIVKTREPFCTLTPGRWWITMNPKTETDWGYVVADNSGAPPCGDATCDALLRDGQGDNPCCTGGDGFGVPDWTPSGAIFGGINTIAMRIQCGFAQQEQWIYRVNKVKRKTDQCGCTCQECTHRVGDIVCYDLECFQTPPDKLKAFESCHDCSACQIQLLFIGRGDCPDNAKKCRCD